jgi:thioredoxin-like negative regulator of GroEL
MIERLVLAAALIALLWGAGTLVRRWSRNRSHRLATSQSLSETRDGIPQVVSFFGPQCDACDAQKQIIDRLQLTDRRTASVRFVDAVAESAYARQFGVIVVPTTIVASATGHIVGISCGLLGSEALAEQLKLAS